MSDNIKDFLLAIKEEGITAFLESETFKVVVTELIGMISSEQAGLIVGSILGAAAPRVNGVFLAYKQYRFERNITALVKALTDRVDTLEANVKALSGEEFEKFRTIYIEMLLDNVINERQEDKIKWNVEGYVNMMNNESNENIMQLFFDTLNELTVLDIDVLKMYDYYSSTAYWDIENKYGISNEQMKLVKEKLVRNGLLNRKNDLLRNTNNDNIVEYLQNLEKERKKTNPKDIKLPTAVKKIGTSELYKITSLGRSFLIGIGEAND